MKKTITLFFLGVALFSLIPSAYSNEPLWKKYYETSIDSVVISENGDLVGLTAGRNIYLLDKDGKKLFNKTTGLATSIGFYNFSNNWFYCAYPKCYFYDTGAEEPREINLAYNSDTCINKVIDNAFYRDSSNNLFEMFVTSDSVLDATGRKISDSIFREPLLAYTISVTGSSYKENTINPYSLNGSAFSSMYMWGGILRYDVWGIIDSSSGLTLNMVEESDITSSAALWDASKDGSLLAVSRGYVKGDVGLYYNNGTEKWHHQPGGLVSNIFIPKSLEEINVIAVSQNHKDDCLRSGQRDMEACAGYFYRFDSDGNILMKGNVSGTVETISIDGAYITIEQMSGSEKLSYFKTELIKPKLIVLANEIDKSQSKDIFDELEQSVDIIYSNADDFQDYKDEKNILILGGPKAYDGIGAIVQEFLSTGEEDSMIKGPSTLLIKNNAVKSGQRVHIIGGKDREETHQLFKESKEEIKFEY